MTGPLNGKTNGLATRAVDLLKLAGLLSLGVGFGVNYARVAALEQQVDRIEAGLGPPSQLAQHTATQIAVIQTQIAELQHKIDQLQVVLIETRNRVLRAVP